LNNKRNKNAFTLIEILVAFAILTSAIIPIVTIINHYDRKANWNEYFSFAMTISNNTLKNIGQIKLKKLKKVMGYDRKANYENTIYSKLGEVILDLDSIKHKKANYKQKISVSRIFPQFYKYVDKSTNPVIHNSKRALYVFDYTIYWIEKNNRKQELHFEYVKADL